MKKLLNDPDNAVAEMLDGIIAAHPKYLARTDESDLAVYSLIGPRDGKVGIMVGGGSGHEPAFLGYVGKGMADAAAIGAVFTSPTPDTAVACANAIHRGAGVLYMYGNYAGDVMNFDMAAEMCAMNDIRVETVLTTDDVASAPAAEKERRRGVGGGFFAFKIAGAAADMGLDLDGVVRAANKANDSCLTMGVALEPCQLPGVATPSFTLGPDEMEIGLGIHGEPGVRRGPLRSADEVTDDLCDNILAELDLKRGDRVAVLVNGLGGTSRMELYIVNRRVSKRLADIGVETHRSHVGEYVTSLEMGGASISIMKLDDELTRWLDHPADTPMYVQPQR